VPLQVTTHQRSSQYSTDIVSEFHTEAPQATERFAQRPYVVTREGFKPMTLRTEGNESTNEPPCQTITWN